MTAAEFGELIASTGVEDWLLLNIADAKVDAWGLRALEIHREVPMLLSIISRLERHIPPCKQPHPSRCASCALRRDIIAVRARLAGPGALVVP